MNSVQDYNLVGYATFPTKNKIPCIKGWKESEVNIFEVEPLKEYGVVLKEDDLVIDIDPRHFEGNKNSWRELCDTLHLESRPKTFIVQTPSNGLHIYFKKPSSYKIRHTVKAYPGLEFKSAGRYVIGCGATTDKGTYKVFQNEEIAQAPQPLLDFLKCFKEVTAVDPEVKYHDTDRNKKLFEDYLLSVPTIQKGERNNKAYFLSCRGRDFGLSPEMTKEVLMPFFNEKSVEILSSEELGAAIENAYKYNTEPQGAKCPEKIVKKFKTVEEKLKEPVNFGEFDRTATGSFKSTLRNAINFISLDGNLRDIRYNNFINKIEVGNVHWANTRTQGLFWTDADTVQLRYYINRVYDIDFPSKVIDDAILQVSQTRSYHPIKDYLDSLIWDGTKRLTNWLKDFCGAEDSVAVREMAKLTLLAAVGRVYNPGCKYDHILVLEGVQGIGKSSIIRILGGKYSGAIDIDPRNKDTIDRMQGLWVIEIPEMVSLINHNSNNVKAFITTEADKVRLAYARNSVTIPRQSIFIGTINPDDIGYLKDETGNRRFFPVYCSKINLQGLEDVRDQLFAEAVYEYKQGAKLFVKDKETLSAIHVEVQRRQVSDAWCEVIGDYLSDKDDVSITEVYEQCLNKVIGNITRSEQIRIAKILQVFGYSSYIRRVNKSTERRYKYKDLVISEG